MCDVFYLSFPIPNVRNFRYLGEFPCASVEAAGGLAAGCNLFMHCDAAWQGSDEECRRLAEKVLVSTGSLQ